MASDLKLSVVLEAVTTAFNTAVRAASETFSKAEADMEKAAASSSSTVTAAAQKEQEALTSAGRAAQTASTAQVAAAKAAASASTTAAEAVVSATQSVNAANQAVRPPSSFKEFFAGVKEGWNEGAAEARASAQAISTASDAAAAHIHGIVNELSGVGVATDKVRKELASALNLKDISTTQIEGLKNAINSLIPTAANVGQRVADALGVKNVNVDQIAVVEKAVNELRASTATAGAELARSLGVKQIDESQIDHLRTVLSNTSLTAQQTGEAIQSALGLKTPVDTTQIERLRTTLTTLDASAVRVGKDIQDALGVKTINTAQLEKLKTEIASVSPVARRVETESEVALALRNLSTAQLAKVKQAMSGLVPEAQKAGTGIEEGLSLGRLVKSVAAIVTVRQALVELGENAIKMQQITNQLSFATGGLAQGAAAFAFLRETSNSLGLSLEASAKGFAQLTTAVKGTALEGKPVRDLFVGVSQAAAVANLSVADTEGVFQALSQIASKGTVQMEELRGQLGDRLPGALKVAADSMGVTVAELNHLVANGLDATQFLTNFGPALQKAFSAQAAKNLETLGGQLAVLKNQFFDFLGSVNSAGAGFGLTVIVKDAADAIATLAQAFRAATNDPQFQAFNTILTSTYKTVKEDIGAIVDLTISTFSALDTVYKTLVSTLSAFASGNSDAAESLGILDTLLGGLNISLGLVGDALKVLDIGVTTVATAFEAAAGVILVAWGKVVGIVNKDLGASFEELGGRLLSGAGKSFDLATEKAERFKSGTVRAFQDMADAADKANQKINPAAQYEAATKALAEFKTQVTGTNQPLLVVQSQADELSKKFTDLFDRGVISSTQMRTALDEITGAIPPASAGVQDFLSKFLKLGDVKATNFSVINTSLKDIAGLTGDLSPEFAKALSAFAQFGVGGAQSAQNVRTALLNLIPTAKTETDITALTEAFQDMAKRMKLSFADTATGFNLIADQAAKLKTVLPQDVRDALDAVGGTTTEENAKLVGLAQAYVERVRGLYQQGVVGVSALLDAQTKLATAQAAGIAKLLQDTGTKSKQQLATDIDNTSRALTEIQALYAKGEVGIETLMAARQNAAEAQSAGIARILQAAGSKSNAQLQADVDNAKVAVDKIVAEYQRGEVGIQAVLNQQQKYIDATSQSLQKALDAVGGTTSAQLQQNIAQAAANVATLTEAYSKGLIPSYQAVVTAQRQYNEALAASIPGSASLADVTKRLADVDKEGELKTRAATEARDEFNRKLKELKPAIDEVQIVGEQLNSLFGTLRDSLFSLSAAAANDFGQKLGIQFGYIDGGGQAAVQTVESLREEMLKLSQDTLIAGDFGSIATKMRDITIAADSTKIAFMEQAASANDAANRISALASSGTASLAQLQAATKLSGQSFGILGKSDLTGLNAALDAAKQRITAIEDASRSAADALRSMGDSFQVELLRSQGKNVEAIQLEAKQQADQIDEQIKALGANASADAIAQANRAKDLLNQLTAKKVADQKTQDAADAASKTPTSTDQTPDIQSLLKLNIATPPQASAPQPPTTAVPTGVASSAADTITLKFLGPDGKSATAYADTPQAADDLLAVLTRAGATNISKIGG